MLVRSLGTAAKEMVTAATRAEKAERERNRRMVFFVVIVMFVSFVLYGVIVLSENCSGGCRLEW